MVQFFRYSTWLNRLAHYGSALPPMDFKNRIEDLCAKVISAPDGSDEFRTALLELRTALRDHAEHLRTQIADVREKAFPRPEDL